MYVDLIESIENFIIKKIQMGASKEDLNEYIDNMITKTWGRMPNTCSSIKELAKKYDLGREIDNMNTCPYCLGVLDPNTGECRHCELSEKNILNTNENEIKKNTKKKNISFKFGSLYGTIQNRLQEQGFTIADKDVELFEKFRHAINMLYMHNYISKTQEDKIFKKLAKNITDKAIPLKERLNL
jgi:hypothetical protein